MTAPPTRDLSRFSRTLTILGLVFGGIASLPAASDYYLTLFPETQEPRPTFYSFGHSQGSGATGGGGRHEMFDRAYADLAADHFRVFLQVPGALNHVSYEWSRNRLFSSFIDNGLIRDLQARGVTLLQFSPGTNKPNDRGPGTPAEVETYAANIAQLILDAWEMRGVKFQVTAIQNEANTQQGYGWNPTTVANVAIALRAALDERGLHDVRILPTESASNDSTHQGYIKAIIENPAAYAASFAFGSHSYGMALRSDEESRAFGRHQWMNEAAANGFESATFDREAAKVAARYFNDLNFGTTLWTYFIGTGVFDSNNPSDQDEATKMVTWDSATDTLRYPMKYWYALPMRKVLGNGVRLRRVMHGTTVSNPGIYSVPGTRSKILAAAGVNPDGALGIGVVNNTGITDPTNHAAAETFDVTISIPELATEPSVTFELYRSRVVGGVPVNYESAGTLTAINGQLIVPNLLPKEIACLREVDTPPATPTGLWALVKFVNGDPTIRLRWEPDPNVTTYTVEASRGTPDNFQPLPDATALTPNTFTDTALDITVGAADGLANANNFYRVRATNAAGISSFSEILPVTVRNGIAPAAAVPVAPGSLYLRPLSSGQITLRWTHYATNATGYEVQRSLDNGTTWTTLTPIPSLNALVYTWSDTNLTPATAYTYRVRTLGFAGASDWSTPATASTFAVPAAPTALAGSADTTDIVLTWQDNATTEFCYLVERKSGSEPDFTQIDVIRNDSTTYRDRNVPADTDHTYRIRAIDVAEHKSGYSNEATAIVLDDPSFIVDNIDPTVTISNNWNGSATATNFGGYHGPNYVRSSQYTGSTQFVRFDLPVTVTGEYDIYLRWPDSPSLADSVPVDVVSSNGTTTQNINQRSTGGRWVLLDRFTFIPGQTNRVTIRRGNAAGAVTADAVRAAFVPPAPEFTTFNYWQTQNFDAPQLADPAISGPTATPAADGIPNLLKYHLGLTAWSSLATNSLPAILPDPHSDTISYSFWRSRFAPDATGTIEWSDDLTDWSDEGISPEIVEETELFERIQTTHPSPAADRLFLRLRVDPSNE